MFKIVCLGLASLALALLCIKPGSSTAELAAPPAASTALPAISAPQAPLARAVAQPEGPDALQLQEQALNTQARPEQRHAAVLHLSQIGSKGLPALQIIAASSFDTRPAPAHTVAGTKIAQEQALRTTAMEALDKAGAEHPELKAAFQAITIQQPDPALRFLALIALRGFEQGRPGKLNRYIDSLTNDRY